MSTADCQSAAQVRGRLHRHCSILVSRARPFPRPAPLAISFTTVTAKATYRFHNYPKYGKLDSDWFCFGQVAALSHRRHATRRPLPNPGCVYGRERPPASLEEIQKCAEKVRAESGRHAPINSGTPNKSKTKYGYTFFLPILPFGLVHTEGSFHEHKCTDLTGAIHGQDNFVVICDEDKPWESNALARVSICSANLTDRRLPSGPSLCQVGPRIESLPSQR
ncbi:hypothetical protein B0H16DRAFT_118282 [Mycena metata]|uniref:Uncharacterized protein n=1 Tax=Mycena metata TaxID=1033252 RepID=A0AAD7MYN9_9AGAR|nr:hypothetical protein B0H16DRAFT_118282 [Mycena metata]